MPLSAALCLAATANALGLPGEPAPAREESVRFAVGGDTLAGTLSVPKGEGPHPAIVLLSGGGPDNRDAQIGDFRPFKVLADSFVAQGVAVLRYDDRGVGESRGRGMWDYTLDDHAAEALAAVALLRARAEIDARRIGLLGHSYGTWMATRAAESDAQLRLLVLLAPSALRYRDLQAGYERRNAILAGRSAAEAAEAARFELEVFGAAVRGQRDWREVERLVKDRARRDWDRLADPGPGKVGFDEYFSTTLHSVTLKMGPTPMLRFFWDFDPRPTYAHVRAPVLAVFGEADTLCAPEESVPAVRDALAQGGNHDLTVVVAPGAGHYLQVAGPQGLDFAPGVVEQVAGWVAKRLGSAGRPGEAGPR